MNCGQVLIQFSLSLHYVTSFLVSLWGEIVNLYVLSSAYFCFLLADGHILLFFTVPAVWNISLCQYALMTGIFTCLCSEFPSVVSGTIRITQRGNCCNSCSAWVLVIGGWSWLSAAQVEKKMFWFSSRPCCCCVGPTGSVVPFKVPVFHCPWSVFTEVHSAWVY